MGFRECFRYGVLGFCILLASCNVPDRAKLDPAARVVFDAVEAVQSNQTSSERYFINQTTFEEFKLILQKNDLASSENIHVEGWQIKSVEGGPCDTLNWDVSAIPLKPWTKWTDRIEKKVDFSQRTFDVAILYRTGSNIQEKRLVRVTVEGVKSNLLVRLSDEHGQTSHQIGMPKRWKIIKIRSL
jgi:hypothetical protein